MAVKWTHPGHPCWLVTVDAGDPVQADSAVPAGYVWVRLLGIFVPFRRCRHLWRPLAGRCAARGSTALAGVLTAGFALLAARTVTGLIHGTFLSRLRRPRAALGRRPSPAIVRPVREPPEDGMVL